MNTDEMIYARETYVSLIKSELLGPGSEISLPDIDHELISDAPNTRYSIGILYPRESKMNADNNDAGKVEQVDTEVNNNEDIIGDEGNGDEEGFVKHVVMSASSDD